ncbi:hypothetical protein D3C85_1217060 [compost metagenome]
MLVGHFLVDQPFKGPLLGQVQIVDTGRVVHIAPLAFRAQGFDKAVIVIGDVALANFPAQVDQFVFALALVHEEKHVDPIQRLHCLHGDVIGVAGADADNQKFLHQSVPSGSVPGKRSRQNPLNLSSMADNGSTSIRLNAELRNTVVSAARMMNGWVTATT